MSSLPQEIIRLFIDPFRADPATLSVCSLVCRSWSHRSRALLFQEIRIDCEHRSANQKVVSLHECLSQNRTLSELVHFFVLQNFRWLCTSTLHEPTYKTLGSLFRLLPRLEHLSLQNVRWFSFPYPLKVAFSRLLKQPSLLKLDLDEFFVANEATLVSFISCPPNLKGLSLKDVAVHAIQPRVTFTREFFLKITLQPSDDIDGRACLSTPVKHRGSLENLCVSAMGDSAHILGCLSHPDVFARLQNTRSLQIGDLSNPQFVQWLLSINRLSLEHLDFSAFGESSVLGDNDFENISFHLKDFPALKSFTLSVQMSLSAVERILGDSSTNDLGHFLETLRLAPMHQDRTHWGFIDSCLSQSMWQNLRHVEFSLQGTWADAEVLVFEAQFPKLCERGILDVRRPMGSVVG